MVISILPVSLEHVKLALKALFLWSGQETKLNKQMKKDVIVENQVCSRFT